MIFKILLVFRACNYITKFYDDFREVIASHGKQDFAFLERTAKAMLAIKALEIFAKDRFKDIVGNLDVRYWKKLNENLLSFNHRDVLSEIWQVFNYISVSRSSPVPEVDYVLKFDIELDDLTLPINRFLGRLLNDKEKEPYSYLIAVNIIHLIHGLLIEFKQNLSGYFKGIDQRLKMLEERDAEFKNICASFFATKFLAENGFEQAKKKIDAQAPLGMLDCATLCKNLLGFFEKKKEIYIEELEITENLQERQDIQNIFNELIIKFFNNVQAELLKFAEAEIVDEEAINKLKKLLKWPEDKKLIIPIQQEVELLLR